MDVKVAVQTVLSELPPEVEGICVALSGGLDSCVLLHALHEATSYPLFALHINHGLSQYANEWANFCKQFSHSLSVPIQIIKIDAKPLSGESPEAAARIRRYGAFKKVLPINYALVLAHHANDQAETVLLQLLRGAGLRGLSAMPSVASFQTRSSKGWIVRPFLSLTRIQLEQYAQLHQLSWIDDESNFNIDFDRNYLRHQVLPLLTARWPAALTCLSRSASHCSEAEGLLQELAAIDLKQLKAPPSAEGEGLTQFKAPPSAEGEGLTQFKAPPSAEGEGLAQFKAPPSAEGEGLTQFKAPPSAEGEGLAQFKAPPPAAGEGLGRGGSNTINITQLKKLSLPRIKNVLRYWIHESGFLLPSTVKLQTIIETVVNCKQDKTPCVKWQGAELRRFRDNLYLMNPLPIIDQNWSCLWDLKSDLVLPAELGFLRADDYRDIAEGQLLTVRFRRGGEVMYLGADRGHHQLKKLFQEWNIPPWLRSRIPLIFKDEQLISVVYSL